MSKRVTPKVKTSVRLRQDLFDWMVSFTDDTNMSYTDYFNWLVELHRDARTKNNNNEH